jgi:hypothetical protein
VKLKSAPERPRSQSANFIFEALPHSAPIGNIDR